MAFVPAVSLPSRRSRTHSALTSRPPPSVRQPPRMAVIEANSTDDLDKIIRAADGSLVVIDYSTTWCGPCKVIAPFFEEMSEKHADVVFVKVMGNETSEAAELMRREGVRAVPAFHFWKGEEKVKNFTGARTEELEKSISSLK